MSAARAAWRALGTGAAVVVGEAGALPAARRAVEQELLAIDAACSRFRDDSELSLLNGATSPRTVSGLLYEAIEVAVRAAAATGGLVDPTVGRALQAIGYDRDFDALPAAGPEPVPSPPPGWRCVRMDPAGRRVELAAGALLDLGATCKAWAADRAAARAAADTGVAVLVDLGGDVATAGAPVDGWPVGIADDHAGVPEAVVALPGGGLATSSTTVRRWRRGGREMHHIVDPGTGRPVDSPWRTITVAAATCVDANTASTAAMVLGADATAWLGDRGLPARLVGRHGEVATVGGWPAAARAA